MMVKYNPEAERYIVSMDADEASMLAEDLTAHAPAEMHPAVIDMLRQLDFFYWCAHDGHHLNDLMADYHGEDFENGE